MHLAKQELVASLKCIRSLTHVSYADNKQSLEVEFEHLVMWSQKLALAVVDAPKIVLGILDKAAKEAVLEDWPEFSNIHKEIFVRFPALSVVDSIRNLRSPAEAHTQANSCLMPEKGKPAQ